MTESWEPLGVVAPRALVEARLVLHWAAQLVAAAGAALAPARADDSHTALSWDGRRRALVGVRLGEGAAALRLEDLTLLVVDGAEDLALFELAGQTRAAALDWLGARLGSGPLPAYPHEAPAHAVAKGAPFAPVPDGQAELARWYGNAARLLAPIADPATGAGPLLTWPHHFDLATLLALGSGATKTIGVGLSPGDGSYPEPYFYVSPWPYPAERRGPPLPAGGHWHVEGWFGAVLPGTELTSAGAAGEARARAFLDEAVAASRGLLASG
jgi:hypothetical protein